MKKQIITLLSLYAFWILMFLVQKPLFMLFNRVEGAVFADWIDVITHGFILDFCFAAYFLFIPLLLSIVNNFIAFNIKKFLYFYNVILAVAVTIIFSVDCVLYNYWGFRIDATLFFYLRDFSESLNSVTFNDVLKFLLIALPYFLIVFFTYKYMAKRLENGNKESERNKGMLQKILSSLLLVVFIPVLIVCTRGGLSTATANVGMVYYCDNQKLNLAAVNPAFNLVYSLTKNEDFGSKYQFYDEEFCKREFLKLLPQDDTVKSNNVKADSTFLKQNRPNILVIILESFSGRLIGAVNGRLATYEGKEVTPNLNNIAEHSIVFTQAYSNGMRTDRGIVSILTGFLAQPDMSVIKYPEKTATLPSFAKSLNKAGDYSEMIYGGDVNFANMRSFFFGSGYKNVVDYKDFPAKDKLSKWGVDDAKMFSYLKKRLFEYDKSKPFFTTFLTLSSHEPFDVSMHKFEDKYVNSVAYTDSCIGSFISSLKQTPLWNNTLVVLVADHASKLPGNTQPQDIDYYHIPVIFTGGVIKRPLKVERLMNQTDIPATVLVAMNLPTNEFIYSRNIFDAESLNYAFFVYTNGFGFLDDSGVTFWDNDAGKCVYGADEQREMKGKVLLQTLYKDISKR